MGAPKGNNFWTRRSKHGRDKIFDSPELMEKTAIEYFDDVVANPWMVPEKGQGSESRIYKGNKYVDNVLLMPRIKPFTLYGFCRYAGADEDYVTDLKRRILADKNYPRRKDFLAVIGWIYSVIREQQYSGAASGLLKENIVSRQLGLADNINNNNNNVNFNSQPLTKDEIKDIAKGLDDEL